MSFSITPTADQLRELLPDVAVRMEHELIIRELKDLMIVSRFLRRKGELVIEISLTHKFRMKIRATDIGPGNYKEFFTFIKIPRLRQGENHFVECHIRETVRAHVEISDSSGKCCSSQTFHEENIKSLIKSALLHFYQNHKIALEPVRKSKKLFHDGMDNQFKATGAAE